MAGRGADEGGRKPAGSGSAKAPHRHPEVTVPGTEIAGMERRKAPVSFKRGHGKTNTDALYRRSIPSLFARGTKGKTVSPAPQNHGRFYTSSLRRASHIGLNRLA